MFGGQQIRAYKTMMKTLRYLPRHTDADVRLFRVISWGAVIVLAVVTAFVLTAKIVGFDFSAEPVFFGAIPIALALLFCWWLTDVAPVVSRWLAFAVASFSGLVCIALAVVLPIWEQIQLSMLLVYSLAVLRTAWLQIRAGVGKEAP